MASFSERYGYKPNRSQLHQHEDMDDRLRNTIWNFLMSRYLSARSGYSGGIRVYEVVRSVWTEVAGGRSDNVPGSDGYNRVAAVRFFREWYFAVTWNEAYDTLEHLLSMGQSSDVEAVNAMLGKEGSAYRFVNGGLVPITGAEELDTVETATQLSGQFHGASQHIAQAVRLLGDRENPDFRNALKESISAVESAVQAVVGDANTSIEKGLERIEGHSQLKQAWKNMYNWTSDEDGIRHGIGVGRTPQVGLPEARYMVVSCSAFVNYLVAKSSEG